MQEIKAYIKHHKLDDVTLALHGVGGVSSLRSTADLGAWQELHVRNVILDLCIC